MESSRKIKVGVLTSSRADYGIYQPLLRKLSCESFFDTEVIAFGTHLMDRFGHTVDFIYGDGFRVTEVPGTMRNGDLPVDIAHSMASTLSAFSDLYKRKHYRLLFALGDRYEMFSAVAAAAPFNIPVAHIHGGETTLGAIDNYFRHSITCFSKFHFTSHEVYRNRVTEIIGRSDNVYNVGALSIDNLKQLELLEITEIKEKYNIDFKKPTVLFTFHPETVDYKRNKTYIGEILNALKKLDGYQILVTMPNADTMGALIRKELIKAKAGQPNIITVETFGTLGYLSAMKHCSFMLGNTSSGFVEASYFSKPVINLGHRQNGRIITPNIFTVPIKTDAIVQAIKKIESSDPVKVDSIYGTGNAATGIIQILKREFDLNHG